MTVHLQKLVMMLGCVGGGHSGRTLVFGWRASLSCAWWPFVWV